jgi:hypothetical protein
MQYSIVFQNDSTNFGNACVYQRDANIGVPNVMSLAWFSQSAYPTTNIVFDWDVNYSFVWGETGVLIPGVTFSASQTWSADPVAANQVGLTFATPAGLVTPPAFTFTNITATGTAGSLSIAQDGTIPGNLGSVGLAVSGSPAFVAPAQPNLNLVFTPHPSYWITFGNYTPGQVLNVEAITNSAQIAFPPNVYTMFATCNADNSWSISQTPA